MSDQATVETRPQAEAIGGSAKYWQGQLELADKDHADFIKDGKEVVRRYKGIKDTKTRTGTKRFNILFSNTETLKSAVFARMAKPDIRRRFTDKDPVGKQVAEIIERAAIYTQDSYDSEKAVERAIEDYLLPGRGVVRVCYEPKTAKGDDGKEYVSEQDLYEEYVGWDDYRSQPAKTWDKVTWEAFRHLMTRKDLRDNFKANLGEDVETVPLNWSPKPEDDKIPDAFKRAEVWEIWDKETRRRIWVVPGFAKVCREDDDPLGLEDFFPNAEPLTAVSANDTIIPKPEFSIYQDQADGLDEIENRIDKLTRALKRRGVYDAVFKELGQLARANDNQFIPVMNYADMTAKGGLAATFEAEDLSKIAIVLKELHAQRDLRVQTIYEVVGIADIMRGDSDPRETLGAQKIKAQFGGNRLKKRQDKVQKWIRDTLRIKSEIIAEHFEPQKLAEMTGFKYVPAQMMQQMMMQAQQQGQPPQQPPLDSLITDEMIQVMRSDKLRSYRVDVETDSTVFEDAEAEKMAVTEMLRSASEFVTAWMPVLQAQPAMLDLAFEMLTFALRHFKMGRTLEQVVEETKGKLQQAAQQPQPKDPKVQAEETKAQAAKDKAQLDMQIGQQKLQLEGQRMQMEMEKMQAELQMMREKMGLEMQAEQQKLAMEQQRGQQEMAMDQQRMGMESEQMEREAAFDEQSMSRKIEAEEHSHELGMEAADHKHKTGLEMMAQKAKQAKSKPNGARV